MNTLFWIRILTIIFLINTFKISFAQETSKKSYFIQFTDKKNSPYSLSNPEAYLSQRAIDRRIKHNINFFTEQDIPVNPNYLDSIKSLGVEILFTSKWFNSATIVVDTDTIISDILNFTFVKKVERVFKKVNDNSKSFSVDNLLYSENNYYDFGDTFPQISLLNGHYLHDKGFLGNGVLIAIIDGGFFLVDSLSAFEHTRNNNKIITTYDFVDGEANVYDNHVHGMFVMSCIAGQIPGLLIGTAIEASFILLRSENVENEYLIEEDAWIAAAEFADSAGADIINSSLGYSNFDNPAMNHTYEDMDGNTTRVSIGADIAAGKGILVVNSVGNEGERAWGKITAPSDGDSVLAVGAVNRIGDYAKFSSRGPSSDGDIKPNVVAVGEGTVIASTYDGMTTTGKGTSLSAPIIAGLAACLIEAFPTKTNIEIMRAIEKSARLYANPNDSLGYGIPDFGLAFEILKLSLYPNPQKIKILELYPNPFRNEIYISFFSEESGELEIIVTDYIGRLVSINDYRIMPNSVEKIKLDLPFYISSGLYFVIITDGKNTARQKIIKLYQDY